MAKALLDDRLWKVIEPLLPAPKPRRFRYPGRKPVSNRPALTGILFVLISGIPWEDLPQEMGCGSGMTCWRRLRDWQAAGVWQQIHETLLAQLQAADQLDWSRAVVDSSPVRALHGGKKQDPIRPIKPKPGANTMSLRRRTAFPWRPFCPVPTPMMSRNCCRWSKPFRRFGASGVALGGVRTAYKAIGAMTRSPIDRPCGGWASNR